jgi:hypothetical protein
MAHPWLLASGHELPDTTAVPSRLHQANLCTLHGVPRQQLHIVELLCCRTAPGMGRRRRRGPARADRSPTARPAAIGMRLLAGLSSDRRACGFACRLTLRNTEPAPPEHVGGGRNTVSTFAPAHGCGVCTLLPSSRQLRCRDATSARAGEVKDAAARDAERRKREGHRRTLSPVAHRTPEYGCKVGSRWSCAG